ncbi:hypothetical protein IM774_09925 [Erysipelotrichaceae bacterium RD49]|nr:hypothetical protein [Erysipelotrichaceae bacterium RD49]
MIGAVVLVFVLVVTLAALLPQALAPKRSLTYLDEIKISDLTELPPSSFEDNVEVKDMTIYGNSLVFYDNEFTPMETDGFFGRNVTLRNIQDGSTISTAFSGGADAGIDLQTLPQGVYEVYLSDGYKPKRAYTQEAVLEDTFITMRDNGKVKKIQIASNPYYLDRYNIQMDKPYLFVAVTQSDPLETVADVCIDPSTLAWPSDETTFEDAIDGFSETQQAWALAEKIKANLESTGLKVIYAHQKSAPSTYVGADSSIGAGYRAQAKIFLSLSMFTQDFARPYVLSSPFTNGKLGNEIVTCLNQNGVELENISTLTQLNSGNGYDLFQYDETYTYTQLTQTPAIRESGGKVTTAGKADGFEANSQYTDAYGMNGVLFCFASTENAESRTYFLEHIDAIATGISQGILNYAQISTPIDLSRLSAQQVSQDLPASTQSGQPVSLKPQSPAPEQPGSSEPVEEGQ